jgi:hypothetical protein
MQSRVFKVQTCSAAGRHRKNVLLVHADVLQSSPISILALGVHMAEPARALVLLNAGEGHWDEQGLKRK